MSCFSKPQDRFHSHTCSDSRKHQPKYPGYGWPWPSWIFLEPHVPFAKVGPICYPRASARYRRRAPPSRATRHVAPRSAVAALFRCQRNDPQTRRKRRSHWEVLPLSTEDDIIILYSNYHQGSPSLSETFPL